MSEAPNLAQARTKVGDAVWNRVSRSTVGFAQVRENNHPASLGSGTLIKIGNIVGIVTCAHVLEALLKEAEIGIMCCPVRSTQIQTTRLPMTTTDSIAIGGPPWGKSGPDLAFLRLPTTTIGDLERVATIANGGLHRKNIVARKPSSALELRALTGVVDELTETVPNTPGAVGTLPTTAFKMVISISHVFSDDENADRFRFLPAPNEKIVRPTSYKGTSGGGFWRIFFNRDDCSIVQTSLIGLAYWEEHVRDQLYITGHAKISIYDTLFNAIRQKWPRG
jgi:hypothetical protein